MMQLDQAKKSYEKALKLKKDYVEAMNNIGTVYYAKKSYRRAVSWYNKALKAAPEESRSASIYMNLGTAYFARKKYKDAVVAYQAALQIDPEVFERRGTYGVMLEERRVEERAKYHFYIARLYAQGGPQRTGDAVSAQGARGRFHREEEAGRPRFRRDPRAAGIQGVDGQGTSCSLGWRTTGPVP